MKSYALSKLFLSLGTLLYTSNCFVVSWLHPSTQLQRIRRSYFADNRRISSKTQRYMSVESISFESLSSNHEDVGQEMANSLQRMLDTEWMPQEIHMKMAQRVKESYIKCRTTDETADIMTIMTTVADDLTAHWAEYDKDAFVNAWDVANYVSDFLTTKAGGESCGCTSKIY